MNSFDNLEQDSEGTYRSKPLPRVAGTKIQLTARIDKDDGLACWQQRIDDPNQIIVVDLFSGAGGLSLGFEQAGFFVAAGIDHDESSVMTHAYNFLSKSVQKDISEIEDPKELIRDLDIPRVDVIIGGPPCQGFSRVGRGKLRSVDLEEYYTSVINELYQEFIRFVAQLQPLAFVMENVPDMATFNDGDLLRKIKDTFEHQLNYKISYTILDSVYYGVPQRRKRLFIQGNRIGSSINWPAPRLTEGEIITVRDAIGDLPCRLPPSTDEVLPYHSDDPSEYQKLMRADMLEDQQNVVFDHIIRAVREDDKVIFSLMKEGDRYCDIPEEFQRYRSDIFKDKYWKLYWDEPSWTITAHVRKDSYRYIHPDPDQGRMLSIREFARLQSFPDRFRFCGAPTRRMQQIGNAVPPLLSESIAKELYLQICHYRNSHIDSETENTATESIDEQSA
jgi:DNA (cytosine-5)-methyltransferase 1